MKEDKFAKKWEGKLEESVEDIAYDSPKYAALHKLFRGTPPESRKTEDEKRFNLFIPLVGPMIDTIEARELMYFFSHPGALTVKIVGARHDEKAQRVEDCVQTGLQYLLAQPFRFPKLFCNRQDALIYGNAWMKVMPADNPYNVFKSENINGWEMKYDPHVDVWDEVGWAAHEKIVPLSYFEGKDEYLQDVIKGIGEGKIDFDPRYPSPTRSGILLTEVWDKGSNKLFAMANRSVIIREPEEFPYEFPYVMNVDKPESNRIRAIGEAESIQWIQVMVNILTDIRMDSVVRTVHNALLVPPGIDEDDIDAATPGGLIPWTGGPRPEPLYQMDITKGLDFDIMKWKEEAKRVLGVFDVVSGDMPTERVATPVAAMSAQSAGARFWLKMKIAETHFYIPWAEKIISLMQKAPDDFFSKVVGFPKNEGPNKDVEYEQIKPSDLEGYDIQIQARMSYDIVTDLQKRQMILEVLRIAGTAWNDWVDREAALNLFLDAYREVDGIKDIFKVGGEGAQAAPSQMEQIVNLLGGGGKIAPKVTQ